MPARRKRKKEPDKPEIQSNLSEEEWIEKGKNSDSVGLFDVFLALETFFSCVRPDFFMFLAVKSFASIAGLFGIFWPS